MSTTRRDFLRHAATLGAVTAIPVVTACTPADDGDGWPQYEWDGPLGPETIFAHGVASGDPATDAVVLWTRAAIDGEPTVALFVEVSESADFARRVYAGAHQAAQADDYTFKLDVDGLRPGTTYYYRFFAHGRESPVGRTRTAPAGPVDHLRFAFCSCSNYAYGLFHAYRRIAERADLDAVIHLGDYIYEYGDAEYGDFRPHDPPFETVTLEDYRRRYAQYRTDPDLAEAHRQHPFIVVWDDHEITNDAWVGGAENHQPATEGDWEQRKAAARKAYFEYMPIRFEVSGEIYRALSYGDLLDVIMLDTRLTGRQAQVPVTSPEIFAPGRQLLGQAQESWLLQTLSASTATWRLLGQQVVMGHTYISSTDGMRPFNADAWDGYQDARTRLLGHLRSEGIENVVVITGDIHSSWAFDLHEDPFDAGAYDPDTGSGAVAVEFVTPAVTSPGFPAALAQSFASNAVAQNPHLKWCQLTARGYVVLDVRPSRVQADWFHIDDISAPSGAGERFVQGAYVDAGTAGLRLTSSPADAKPRPPALAR